MDIFFFLERPVPKSRRAALSDRPIEVLSHPGIISFPRGGIFPYFLVSPVPSSVASMVPITSPASMVPMTVPEIRPITIIRPIIR